MAITWFCKHLNYSTTEAFLDNYSKFSRQALITVWLDQPANQLWTTPPFTIKSREINVWRGFYSYLGVWISRMDFTKANPGDKNADLHVPCSFLIQLLRARPKNLEFVSVI